MKRKEQICRFYERTARRKHNLEYEVSTTFLKQLIVLIPLTFSHQCMSVFLLECSDFWSSRIVLQKDVIRKGEGVEDVGVGGMILTSS